LPANFTKFVRRLATVAVALLFEFTSYAGNAWILIDTPSTWSDAKANAPSGYRLPKRWEVLKAFDESSIGSINSQVWTADCPNEIKCWYVVLSNKPGYLVSESKLNDPNNQQHVLYIRDGDE
jgi:hypothetical protein